MKKIITLFVFIFALSFNANAQEGKTALELGTVDAQALAQYLEISGPIVKDLQNLFVEKHQVLLTEGVSQERINIMTEIIDHKLAATLDASEMEKLKADQVLYKKLIKN
jgi:hypothetical protein